MKILIINVVCGIGSTGRICTDLATVLSSNGHEVKIAYGRGGVPDKFKKFAVRIGTDFDVYCHGVKARLNDGMGFGSKKNTERFIEWIKNYNPDIIHLHNLHGYYLNIEILFNYLKLSGKKIFWTLHDCWPFTGHCVYCQGDQCEKWKTGCFNCPVYNKEYPISYRDKSKENWVKKKKYFDKIENIVLITPSKWLADKVKDSYLSKYPVIVINNGIDTSVFRMVNTDIKERFLIENKEIVLGVASVWDNRKGLGDFIELSMKLPEKYKIVLIGVSKKQMKKIPSNILAIERTNNINELVEWYSVAKVFFNPTYEDNYPTTNLEAIACGTPVLTYNTGGSPESASKYGVIVNKNIDNILEKIESLNELEKSEDDISINNMIEKYILLYEGKL